MSAIAFGLDWNDYFKKDTEFLKRQDRSFINDTAFDEGDEQCSVEIHFTIKPDDEIYIIKRIP